MRIKNLFISNLHEKDIEHCTTNFGLWFRKEIDKPFKKLCNIFTNANITYENGGEGQTDEEYFENLDFSFKPLSKCKVKEEKNNIVVERYPELEDGEPYIFVCNHTCPEDIETVLNVIDRNAYLILGSIESLQYNPEMYLSYLNGMIPFDILDDKQRKVVFQKMLRVLKTNSILIFPEGSHNYSPNNLINPLFDGPINLALKTKRKIVIVTMIKDQENNVSYIDVSNPLDAESIVIDSSTINIDDPKEREKYYVKRMSLALRDKMATAVYSMISRHFEEIKRSEYYNIEEYLRNEKIKEAFSKLKWDNDVFDAEYLVKKTKDEKDYESVVSSLSNLFVNNPGMRKTIGKEWILLNESNKKKIVSERMREYWLATNIEERYFW